MFRLKCTRWITVLMAMACWATIALAADTALNSLSPSNVFNLDPAASAGPTASSLNLPSGAAVPALKFLGQTRVTYDVPAGAVSFKATVSKAEALSAAATGASPDDINRMRVRFLVDGKGGFETTLDVSTPPEQLAFPLNGGRKLTIAVDQMIAGDALILADAAFSTQAVKAPAVSYLLRPGAAYANYGSNARQIAFRVYHPGESVPLHLEFAGAAQEGSVSIQITPVQNDNLRVVAPAAIAVPIKLQGTQSQVSGDAQWKVPNSP